MLSFHNRCTTHNAAAWPRPTPPASPCRTAPPLCSHRIDHADLALFHTCCQITEENEYYNMRVNSGGVFWPILNLKNNELLFLQLI